MKINEKLSMILDCDRLATAINHKRSDQSLRYVAKQIGTSTETISRIENRKVDDFSVSTFLAFCNWLDANPNSFIIGTEEYAYARIVESISEPKEKIAAVTGQLLMANFGREKYRCHLYLADDKRISCTFDEDVIDEIDQAMRHQVNAIGIATLNPVDEGIDQFHIKQIIILDDKPVSPQQLTEALNTYIEEHDTVASFRQSWQEALAGDTIPLSELWDGIDAE